jgi:hypothetical protein
MPIPSCFDGYRLPIVGFAIGWFVAVVAAAPPDPTLTPPWPAIVALAESNRLPLSGLDRFADGADLNSGDFVTVLFTFTKDGKRKQWLAELRAGEVTVGPESADRSAIHQTIYTSSGLKFEFTSRTAALALRMFGPCEPNADRAKPVAEKDAQIGVHSDFLHAGFDAPMAITLRVATAKIPFPYLISSSPFSPERIADGKVIAQKAGLTLVEEKAFAASGPALDEFLGIAQHTPGLKELVFEIIDLPPPWAWLGSGNTGFFFEPPNIVRLDGERWGIPGTPVYYSPFTYWLKGHAAMKGAFYFTSPQPPLLTCAGILGLEVSSPKHPEKTLELRVLAARRTKSL